MKRGLAIDIGASSGRHIVGWLENGQWQTDEVYRFENGVTERDGHLCWDIDALLDHVRRGIALAKARHEIESLSIDTWGVDYVLLNGDETICPVYAYRDSRTEAVIDRVHACVPFSELYRRTGIQFQPFNTVYQLSADRDAGRLEAATDFLMIPEYLMYRLCGVKSREYTNATTTGMVNAETGEYDPEIIDALGLPKHLFHKLQQPGTAIGTYEGIKVVLCATHDTGSAVEGIPMDGNEPYISSGTWSLLGVKTEKPITDEASERANWSNEGGVGYNRYQKNIMGMWLPNRLRAELCPETPWSELLKGITDLVICLLAGTSIVIFEPEMACLDFVVTKVQIAPWLYVILAAAFLWLMINAVNCADGIDGLSSSLAINSMIGAAACAAVLGKLGSVAPGAAVMSAVLLAYLQFNCEPSTVLMGDAGSRPLGLFLGILFLRMGNALFAIPVCIVFLADGLIGLFKLLVIRLTKKQDFMKNLRTPLHDHLRKNLGSSNAQVRYRFNLAQIIVSAVFVCVLLMIKG